MLNSDLQTLRTQATAAFMAGISAADPSLALVRAFEDHPFPIAPTNGQTIIIAVGKAACKMADQTVKSLPQDAQFTALAVTNFENVADVANCTVIGASHPIPCQQGIMAGQRVQDLLRGAAKDDTVVMLISGGASALLPAPVNGISLEDKILVNELLLRNGLDIYETNLVRQSLSDLKGGGALKMARPASVNSYILSDVLGDDLRVVGSGPSVGKIGIPSEARRVLLDKGIFSKLPHSVRTHLDITRLTVRPSPPSHQHLIAGNDISVKALAKAANATIISPPLIGDVHAAAVRVIETVKDYHTAGVRAVAFGGETTVEVKGTGQGGRNQELALRVAQLAGAEGFDFDWCFLSGGTDGRDGPTDAAGGIVDSQSLARLQAQGQDVTSYLANNDSYHALKLSGDLLQTGPTGTNVADLQVFLIG